MQMREVLVHPAVDDKTVGFEIVFLHEALNGGIQVREKGGVARVEVCQRVDLALWDEEQVKLMAGRRMLKRNQVRGLAEAFDGEDKAHVGENPADEINDELSTKQFSHLISTFKRLDV